MLEAIPETILEAIKELIPEAISEPIKELIQEPIPEPQPEPEAIVESIPEPEPILEPILESIVKPILEPIPEAIPELIMDNKKYPSGDEIKKMFDDFNNITLELKNKIQMLEEEKKCLNVENKKLKTTVDEIENKLTFVFNHAVIKTKKEESVKILNPSIWLQANKYELSDYDKMNLEYMRHRNSIIRDRNARGKNHFMPEI
jgi:regulator of replication initiation timing